MRCIKLGRFLKLIYHHLLSGYKFDTIKKRVEVVKLF